MNATYLTAALRAITAVVFVTCVGVAPNLSRSFVAAQTTASDKDEEANDHADIDGESPKNKITTYTYDVSMLLISPLGTISDYGPPHGRQRVPPVPLNQVGRDEYIGTNTELGHFADLILMDERDEDGTNQIAKQNGSLEVTASAAGHTHVRRFLEALAVMPGMNPQNQGRGLDLDRCVSLFTASLSHGGDQLDWVLYDVSDFYEKLSPTEIRVGIESVDRETWGDATGGKGYIDFYEPGRAFLIIAKGDVQQKIKDLFAEQRGVKRKKLPPPRVTGGKKPLKRAVKAEDVAD